MQFLIQDTRYALRQLWKNPRFAAIAVLTLGLGIGANTAIFSVADAVIFRSLSYRDADRLVAIHEVTPQYGSIPVSAPHFLEWQRTTRSFERLTLLYGFSSNLTGGNAPERVAVGRVSPLLFPMLGVQPQPGRTFLQNEDQAGHGRVALIDHALWRRRFGSDPTIVGRNLMLDGTSYQIIGVLPQEFHFPKLSHLYAMSAAVERPEVWIPFVVEPFELANPMGQFNFACIARLKPDVSPAEALSELNVVQATIARQAPQKVNLSASIVPLRDQIVSRSKSGLQLTLGAAGMVLLMGCVNIASLLMARLSTRRHEMAIRGAIGASRGRLIRQMLVEGLVLSGIGALAGVLMAHAAMPLILSVAPANIPRLDEVRLDFHVLLFALAIATLTGLLIGLVPALRLGKSDLQSGWMPAMRATANQGSRRIRSFLISIEVALALMCLAAGGLLLHSLLNLLNVNRGFNTQHIVSVDVNLGLGDSSHYSTGAKKIAFVDSAIGRLRTLPGIIAVGIADKLPLSGEGGNSLIYVDGPDVPLFDRPNVAVRTVNPDYFRVLGIALHAGRLFDESDRDRRVVAVVSASTAEHAWPGQNPIGKRFRFRTDGFYDVIGVVNDVRGISLERNPAPHVYLPYWQGSLWAYVSFAVKTATTPPVASSAIRTGIREIDPELPLSEFRTMDDVVAGSVAERQFQMNLVLLFGVVALLLALIGIYGVVSYAVVQRTSEIGIRLALGAPQAGMLRMILFDTVRPLVIGLTVGVTFTIAIGFSMRALLFGIVPYDLAAVLAAVTTITIVAIVASYVPARRASRLDPLVALRHE